MVKESREKVPHAKPKMSGKHWSQHSTVREVSLKEEEKKSSHFGVHQKWERASEREILASTGRDREIEREKKRGKEAESEGKKWQRAEDHLQGLSIF